MKAKARDMLTAAGELDARNLVQEAAARSRELRRKASNVAEGAVVRSRRISRTMSGSLSHTMSGLSDRAAGVVRSRSSSSFPPVDAESEVQGLYCSAERQGQDQADFLNEDAERQGQVQADVLNEGITVPITDVEAKDIEFNP